MNLLLSDEADAMENIPGLVANIRRVAAASHLRAIALPSSTMGYLLFNQRDRADRSRPHPILGDPVVRRAIRLALDRQAIVRATFDRFADVPYGPVSQLLWIRAELAEGGAAEPARSAAPPRLARMEGQRRRRHPRPGRCAARARAELSAHQRGAAAGRRCSCRSSFAAPASGSSWRGSRARCGTSAARRGDFDIDFSSALQDPTPSGLTQGWSCGGGTNVAKYCNPRVDSLLERAIGDPAGGGARHGRRHCARSRTDAPAVFMYAPLNVLPREPPAPGRAAPAGVALAPALVVARGVSGWLLRRAAQAAATLAVVLVLLFFLMRIAPGDPLTRITDRPLAPAEIAVLRARYGLDQPMPTQFAAYLRGAVRGDFGTSIEYGRPVAALIAERLPATLLLGGVVLLVNFTLGIWLGALQATHRGTLLDRSLTAVSLAGHAVPSFWLGLVLAWLVGVRWRLLPAAGMQDPLLDPSAGLLSRAGDVLAHLALPALTLCVVSLAATMRYQRRAMIEVLRFPYIATARAKGRVRAPGAAAAMPGGTRSSPCSRCSDSGCRSW